MTPVNATLGTVAPPPHCCTSALIADTVHQRVSDPDADAGLPQQALKMVITYLKKHTDSQMGRVQ
jgi:hypothetical protein